MSSHAQSVQAMQGAAKQMGDQARRGVQLWAMASAIVDEAERTAAGIKFAADAAARWQSSRADLATAIDALALSTGLTRQQILDDLAAAPATNFG